MLVGRRVVLCPLGIASVDGFDDGDERGAGSGLVDHVLVAVGVLDVCVFRGTNVGQKRVLNVLAVEVEAGLARAARATMTQVLRAGTLHITAARSLCDVQA